MWKYDEVNVLKRSKVDACKLNTDEINCLEKKFKINNVTNKSANKIQKSTLKINFSFSHLINSFLSDSIDAYNYRPRTFLADNPVQNKIEYNGKVYELDTSDWWLNMTEEPSNETTTTTTTLRPEYPAVMKDMLEKYLGPRNGTKPTSKNFKGWDFTRPYSEAQKLITDFDCNI